MNKSLKIGTRGSKLALIQANWVKSKLADAHPDIDFEIEIIKTVGDKINNAPFAEVGEFGIFAREIESALLDGRIDIAVHSLKDMQTSIPDGLIIGAIPERVGARDVLLSRESLSYADLPDGAVIGSSSARRRGLLNSEGRDFEIRECRGNLPRRIEKLRDGEFDAILLAEAGLIRMEMTEVISDYFDVGHFVPAVGQGALGIEVRENDKDSNTAIKILNHERTYNACTQERQFLSAIGGGCHAPVGAHVFFSGEQVNMVTFVGTTDGSWSVRRKITLPEDEIHSIAEKMTIEVKSADGIEAFYSEVGND